MPVVILEMDFIRAGADDLCFSEIDVKVVSSVGRGVVRKYVPLDSHKKAESSSDSLCTAKLPDFWIFFSECLQNLKLYYFPI